MKKHQNAAGITRTRFGRFLAMPAMIGRIIVPDFDGDDPHGVQ